MPNRERLLLGLDVCIAQVPGKYDCHKCPYEVDGYDCKINLLKDATILLKGREAIKPLFNKQMKHFVCPNCFLVLDEGRDNYCPSCGKRIAWDEYYIHEDETEGR